MGTVLPFYNFLTFAKIVEPSQSHIQAKKFLRKAELSPLVPACALELYP